MKSTGIIRKVDEFGRIVIPSELRRNLAMDIKDPVEFFVDGKNLILRKSIIGCSHCGMMGTVFELGNIKLCGACRDFCTGFAVGYFLEEPREPGVFLSQKREERKRCPCNRQ